MKSKILIIGGSGFVDLSYKQADKSNIINYDKRNSLFFPDITIIGNILDVDLLNDQFKGIDQVILLAAEHRDNISPTSLYYDVNVTGTKNVLNAMDLFNVKKLIFTSSVAIYGLDKNNPDELYDYDPFNDYGKSKLKAEMLLGNGIFIKP